MISNDVNYEIGDIVAIVPPNDVKKLMISRGYLKEKGHQGKTIEQDKIVVLLQECANSRDQVLLYY